jgi:hypothetical protein
MVGRIGGVGEAGVWWARWARRSESFMYGGFEGFGWARRLGRQAGWAAAAVAAVMLVVVGAMVGLCLRLCWGRLGCGGVESIRAPPRSILCL